MADFVESTPRNQVLGFGADTLFALRAVARALAAKKIPVLSGMGDLVDLTIARNPELLDKLSYGERVSTGSGETWRPNDETLDPINFTPFGKALGGAVRRVGEAVGKAPAAASFGQAGAILPKGRDDLYLVHGATVGAYNLPRELSSPSLAITSKESPSLSPFHGNVTFVAKPGAFDPGGDVPAALFNRDAYAWRRRDYREARVPDWGPDGRLLPDDQILLARAVARLKDRFSTTPEMVALKEGFGEKPGVYDRPREHYMAIKQSPIFPNLGAYEGSPVGAGALSDGWGVMNSAGDLKRDLDDWLRSNVSQDLYLYGDPDQVYKAFLAGAQRGDPAARQVLSQARRLPSEYAELKVHGPIPLATDRWAGALVGESDHTLASKLSAKGIPVETFKYLDEMRDVARALQAGGGKVQVQVPSGYTGGKASKKPHIDEDLADYDELEDMKPLPSWALKQAPAVSPSLNVGQTEGAASKASEILTQKYGWPEKYAKLVDKGGPFADDYAQGIIPLNWKDVTNGMKGAFNLKLIKMGLPPELLQIPKAAP